MPERTRTTGVPAPPSRGVAGPFDLRDAARRAAAAVGAAEPSVGPDPVVIEGDAGAWERGLAATLVQVRALGGVPTLAVWRVRSAVWLEVRTGAAPVPGGEGSLQIAVAPLAESLGGTVSTTWEPGRGLALVLRATLTEERAGPEPERQRLRVLVLDDDALVRRGIARLLSRHHEVVEAADEPGAASLLRSTAVDVVLCDLHLGPVSGLDVARRLRTVAPEPRIVLMSGFLDPAQAEEVLATFSFLQKPFSAAEFTRVAAPSRAAGVD